MSEINSLNLNPNVKLLASMKNYEFKLRNASKQLKKILLL